MKVPRLVSNIESKSSNNNYLNIIETFNKLLEKLNIIELRNLVVVYFDQRLEYAAHLVVTSTKAK